MKQKLFLWTCLFFIPFVSRAGCEDSLSQGDILQLLQQGRKVTVSTRTKLSNSELQMVGLQAQPGQITLRLESDRFSYLDLVSMANFHFAFQVVTSASKLSYLELASLHQMTSDRPLLVVVDTPRLQFYELQSLVTQGIALSIDVGTSGLATYQIQAMANAAPSGQVNLQVSSSQLQGYELMSLRQQGNLGIQISITGASHLSYAELFSLCQLQSNSTLTFLVDGPRLSYLELSQLAATGAAELWIDPPRSGLQQFELNLLLQTGHAHILAR